MSPEERATAVVNTDGLMQIIRDQWGAPVEVGFDEQVLKVAIATAITAAVEEEREAIAKICDGLFWREHGTKPVEYRDGWKRGLELAEQAINARANVSKPSGESGTTGGGTVESERQRREGR